MTRGLVCAVSLCLWAAGCVSPALPGTAPSDAPAAGERAPVPAGNVTDGRPLYHTLPATISKLSIVARAPSEQPGIRVLAWDDRAYVTNLGDGFDVHSILLWDLSSPMEPRRLPSVATGVERRLPLVPNDEFASLDGGTYEGIDVLAYGGRTVVAASIWTAEGYGTETGPVGFWDVSDPDDIRELARIRISSHTLAAHRPAQLVYSADHQSEHDVPGNRGAIDILDATDPDRIALTQTWRWPAQAEDGTTLAQSWCYQLQLDHPRERLYCAAEGQTLVIDVSSPAEPRVVTAITYPEILMANGGTVLPILDGRYLAVMARIPPAVLIAQAAGQRAVWFYDMEESPPALVGKVELPPGDEPPRFATEVGEGTGILAVSRRGEGFVLIDASDPSSPRVLQEGRDAGSVLDLTYYRGLVFATGTEGLLVLSPG